MLVRKISAVIEEHLKSNSKKKFLLVDGARTSRQNLYHPICR